MCKFCTHTFAVLAPLADIDRHSSRCLFGLGLISSGFMRLGCPIGLLVGTLVCLVSLAVAETRLVPEAVPIPKSAASRTPCVPRRLFVKPSEGLKGDASFQRFGRRLADIATRRDAPALYDLLSPDFFEAGCCEDGPHYVGSRAIGDSRAMVTSSPNSSWLLLEQALRVGVMKQKELGVSAFCGAAVDADVRSACDFGASTDGDDMAFVVDTSVPLHSASDRSSAIITLLSWEMVQVLPDGHGWGAPGDSADSDQCMKVRLGNGTTGYVESRFVHWFLGPTICFRKDSTGPWRIAGIDLGGD